MTTTPAAPAPSPEQRPVPAHFLDDGVAATPPASAVPAAPAPSEGSTVPAPSGGPAAPVPSEGSAAPDRFASPVPVANAALIGLPMFLVGSIALALNLIGYVGQAVLGAPIAIIALATGVGLTTATVFALRAGESAVGGIFGIFAGFWFSYAALVLGLLHNWYAVAPTDVVPTVKAFLLTWIILIGLLTLFSLRLPSSFTVLFALIVVALAFVLAAYSSLSAAGAPSSQLLTVAGGFVFAFIAVGAYLFMDAMSAATGGDNLPLGPALVH